MAVEREKMCPRQMWQVINEIVQWMGLDPEAWIKIHAPTELRPGKVYITKYVSDGVGSISLFKIAEGKSPVLGQDIVFGEAIFFNENGLRHREFNPKDSGYKLEEGEHIIELNLFDFSDIAAAFTDIKEGRVHIGTYAPSALEFIKYYADRNGDPYPVFIPSSCSALNHLDLYAIENGTFPRELPPDIFFDHDDFEKWMEGMHEKLRWVDRSKPYDGVIAFPLTQNECFTSKPPSDKKQVNPMDYDTLQMHYDDIMSQARTIFTGKNKDYATSDNALAGFMKTADKAGIHPLQAWSVFCSKHIAAIDAYVKGHSEESEPIEGRIADVINYMAFLYAMVKSIEG